MREESVYLRERKTIKRWPSGLRAVSVDRIIRLLGLLGS
jgi:hypothetical protein